MWVLPIMFGLNLTDERAIKALERIATALEVLARTTDLYPTGEDESAVFYLDDAEQAIREAKKEAYFQATGLRLEDAEDPPSHSRIPERLEI